MQKIFQYNNEVRYPVNDEVMSMLNETVAQIAQANVRVFQQCRIGDGFNLLLFDCFRHETDDVVDKIKRYRYLDVVAQMLLTVQQFLSDNVLRLRFKCAKFDNYLE